MRDEKSIKMIVIFPIMILMLIVMGIGTFFCFILEKIITKINVEGRK